ncbi:MAG: SPOR domain-containing protein [Rhodocyclaceae bacterium]|jgi:DedD protein|nr:SPOR domain-containing protein [Rhodocyclaceae bacterium]
MAAKVPNDFSDEIDSGVPSRSSGAADADLQLKKRARRRLVGAIALALFAIVLLPLVMDREPPPSAPEIQVRIPSPDGAGVIGKIATRPLAAPVAAAPTALPTIAPAVPVETPEKRVAAKDGEPKGMAVTSSVPPETSKEAKPVAPEKASLPAQVVVAPKPEAAPVKSELPKEAPAKEVTKDAVPNPGGKWEVQLGAYQSAGNVNLLLAKVKELRLPVYTEKFDSPQGPRTRVRSGPFASKDSALAAQKRIRIIGVEGQVAPYSK